MSKYLVWGPCYRFDHFQKILVDIGHRHIQCKGVSDQNTILQENTAYWHR